jgi:fibronectin-binding autotransporter adhesin
MSNSSYNFKDNLTIDNNKYLKWLDITGTSRGNIIALDQENNVNINSAFGDMFLNSNNPNSYTFINSNNQNGNALVGTKLGIGFTSTSNMASTLTIVKNGYIGLNTTVGTSDGYLGFSSSFDLSNNSGSRVLLYGNNHLQNPGQIHLYSGNVTNGNVNIYTGNDSLKMQILQDGTVSFIPDGITSRLTINHIQSSFTNDLIITSTTESHNASTGAVQIVGGIGIRGNLYVDGTISLNSATGNINFDSTQTSSSYTSGAIFLSGGIGISTTVNASSHTSGGGISVAGGAAFGKDVYVGGKITIVNTTAATSSQDGSLVVYGGMGINGAMLSRSDESQIQIAPKTNGTKSEIVFFSKNNFTSSTTTDSSWKFGQNVNSIGSGKFGLWNSDFGNVIIASYDGTTYLNGAITIFDTTNSSNENIGGAFTVLGGAAFKKDVYIGGILTLAGGGTISGAGGASEFGYLTLSATDESINLSTGSFVTYGGVTIQCETDAVSITNGGSFLTAGGASIGKSLYIGGPILQIPYGSTETRPTPAQTGFIRYNTSTSQFEGYGISGNWGSLGGVIDVAQKTKILAELSPGENDGNLRFITNDSERMRINSSGNIGIGTSSPGFTLDVTGTLKGSNSNGVFLFASSGNVGIGTTTPSQVHGNSSMTNVMLSLLNGEIGGESGTSRILIGGDNNHYSMIEGAHTGLGYTYLAFGTSTSPGAPTEKMRIDRQGNVGIGTTNPVYTLDVNGKTRYSDSLLATHDSNTIGNLYTTSGNVGINISNPAYTLDVNGNLHVNSDLYVDGLISGGTGTGSTFAYLTLTATDESINSSTGSLLTYGGITIQCPTDAVSVTNGGSILTDGGASIGKNVYIGESLNVTNNVNAKSILINSTQNSIGIGTGGSLTVFGGSSISKNVYIGESLTVTQNIESKNIIVNSTTNSIGIGTGGSFTVLGGASISKDVYVGGTVTSSSDIRLKTNITEFKNKSDRILDKIDNLRSIKYNYINDDSMTPYIGFIAQDFVENFSELLRCPTGGYYSLDYQKMSVVLLECIKELKDNISELHNKVCLLTSELQELQEFKPIRRKVVRGKRIIKNEL